VSDITAPSNGAGRTYVLVLSWPVTVTGGVNEIIFALAHELRKLGWRPLIAVVTWSKTDQPAEWRGISVVNLQLRDLAACRKPKPLAGFLSTSIRDARALRQFIRRENVAVLDFHFPSLETFIPALLWSRKLLGCRMLLSFQGNDMVDILKAPHWQQRVWRFVLSHCDGVTACSGALRDQLKRFLPATPVETVHNGVDHSLFSIPRTSSQRRPLLLQAAKFEHKKAQDVTLRAFRLLLDEGFSADLLLVGSDGPELAQIRALIAELNLTQHVRLEVNVPHDRMPAIMAAADMLVHPSRLEPFGIVLLEAGVVGLPVVATRVGGIPELLSDGETGLLIEPDDVTALANSIRRLLTDSAFASRLATAWQTEVLNRWTWTDSARGHLRVAFGTKGAVATA
jgi:glycosyltransferase involved in cell wall biosynthesis